MRDVDAPSLLNFNCEREQFNDFRQDCTLFISKFLTAKWKAWRSFKGTSKKEDAEESYIDTANVLIKKYEVNQNRFIKRLLRQNKFKKVHLLNENILLGSSHSKVFLFEKYFFFVKISFF